MRVHALLICIVLTACSALAGDHGGISADDALLRLQEGSDRFATGRAIFPNQDFARIEEIVEGQHPFASILSCADSRVPVEMIFDAGFGDLFITRVAGNIAGPEQIGTIEYGAEHLGCHLLVVLGHSRCGAVTATVGGGEPEGSIGTLVEAITPAVNRVKSQDATLEGDALVAAAIIENVWGTIEHLIMESPVLRKGLRDGSLQIVGAIYHLEDGTVEWLGSQPRQEEILAAAEADPGESSEASAEEITAGSSERWQAQIDALHLDIAQLRVLVEQGQVQETMAVLSAEIAELKEKINSLTPRPGRVRPGMASSDQEEGK